jgi:low temperature requirement protein LtrA
MSRFIAGTERASVSELELFFDLVFVFALTRVTGLMGYITASSALHAALAFGVLWWVWVGYAWLGNVVRADRGAAMVAEFAATGVAFVLALAMPQAFAHPRPGELSGPLVFAVGYGVVRLIHVAAFWAASAGDAQLRGQLRRWGPQIVLSVGLFVVAAQTNGTAQTMLWVAALAVDYIGTFLAGTGWRINSARHFSERHGLVILIALGESIVDVGSGAGRLTWPVLATATLGLVLCALLWWTYFDLTAPMAAQALARAGGSERIVIARNCYTFAHLPMMLGIAGAARGLEEVVAHPNTRLSAMVAGLLFGGVGLYLTALLVFKFLALRTVTASRVVAITLVVTAAVVSALIPAWAALGLLVALLAVVVGYETVGARGLRERIHAE